MIGAVGVVSDVVVFVAVSADYAAAVVGNVYDKN
jgi:hypothetical protein